MDRPRHGHKVQWHSSGVFGFETMTSCLKVLTSRKNQVECRFIEEDANALAKYSRELVCKVKKKLEVASCSIGDKLRIVELNGFDLDTTGASPALLIVNNDRFVLLQQ